EEELLSSLDVEEELLSSLEVVLCSLVVDEPDWSVVWAVVVACVLLHASPLSASAAAAVSAIAQRRRARIRRRPRSRSSGRWGPGEVMAARIGARPQANPREGWGIPETRAPVLARPVRFRPP